MKMVPKFLDDLEELWKVIQKFGNKLLVIEQIILLNMLKAFKEELICSIILVIIDDKKLKKK